jgi:hypothetical protein
MTEKQKYGLGQLRGAYGAGFVKGAKEENETFTFIINGTEFPNPIGKWFHTFNEDGVIVWQGQVLKRVDANTYMVQLYDWLIGAPSDRFTIHAREMANWKFYYSDDDMRDYYYKSNEQA